PLDAAAVMTLVPALVLKPTERAVLLTECGRIDVHQLLSSYLAHARKSGATIHTGQEVREIVVENGRCTGVVTDSGIHRGKWIVDAAGAWSGVIAKMAGATPIHLEPRRRSIVTFAGPAGVDFEKWPFIISESEHIYFAPESGGLMLSAM